MRISVLTARKHNNTNFQGTEMSPNLSITEKYHNVRHGSSLTGHFSLGSLSAQSPDYLLLVIMHCYLGGGACLRLEGCESVGVCLCLVT